MEYKYFTSESVCAGHPDKICDQISDAVVDAALGFDPKSRVAVETLVTTNHVTMAGEVTCKKSLDFRKIAREVIRDLGYTNKLFGFYHKSPIDVFIHQQSGDIALGVDNGGAGDQGIMFGYATNETGNFMPMPISIAHRLTEQMDKVRSNGILPYLRPDGKSQVTVLYDGFNRPLKVVKVVLAVPYDQKIKKEKLVSDLYKEVVLKVLAEYKMKIKKDQFIVNGTGKWEIGGPSSDTGVTGRKVIVDTYGGMARHGGGAFSGKDPTKVDRSATYAARFIAKNMVANGYCDRCEVSLSYVIGFREPVAKSIETFGSNHIPLTKLNSKAWSLLDLSVGGIIEGLQLQKPIYKETAVYGHFGRNGFSWENILKI